MFIGRKEELNRFSEYLKVGPPESPQLVVCYGRRRIGKSELIREFGKKFKNYIEIQGLAPAKGMTNETQMNHYLREFCSQIRIPKVSMSNWRDIFKFTSHQIAQKKCLLFLDEISWMGAYDSTFVGNLKITWDTEFKNNIGMVLVLCGSVSTWISDNILYSADFIGRINLDIPLKEMPIKDSVLFIPKTLGLKELILFLCHTGGVPRYLKEYNKRYSVDALIAQLGFTHNGIFFTDFDRVFNDIFTKRAHVYLKIILTLKDGSLTVSEICKKMKVSLSGKYTYYLHDLVKAGFITGFENWELGNPKAESKITRYRITDNYLRFYLKQILPLKKEIENQLLNIKSVFEIKSYESFLGYQFENLIINNIRSLIQILKINALDIINWGPYFQSKTQRQKACQIDLIIQTKYLIYIIEIKSGPISDEGLIKEVQTKLSQLKIPRKYGIKKILIHTLDELSEKVEDYFDSTIPFRAFIDVGM